MRSCLSHVVLLAILATTAAAQVVLNFDDLDLPNYGDIPTTYGDGLDRNVDISYRSFYLASVATITTEIAPTNHLDFWRFNNGTSDYGDLKKIAFSPFNGAVAEIRFTPAEGYGVNLISFDMAGWPSHDLTNTLMRIVDADDNVVYDFAAKGAVAIEGDHDGPQHSTFTPNLSFDGTLRLQWGTDWNVGVDNIAFQAVPLSAVPEPSTWALLVVGTAAVWLAWRPRRRRE